MTDTTPRFSSEIYAFASKIYTFASKMYMFASKIYMFPKIWHLTSNKCIFHHCYRLQLLLYVRVYTTLSLHSHII